MTYMLLVYKSSSMNEVPLLRCLAVDPLGLLFPIWHHVGSHELNILLDLLKFFLMHVSILKPRNML